MGIIIENPGILTTVQDEGRFGSQQFGVSPAGPMDTQSFYIANILVGNRMGEGAIEMTFQGRSGLKKILSLPLLAVICRRH